MRQLLQSDSVVASAEGYQHEIPTYFFFDSFGHWRLESEFELLDAIELRTDIGAIEVRYEICGSPEALTMFRRWDHGTWEIRERQRLR
jgi:hypothetical protein